MGGNASRRANIEPTPKPDKKDNGKKPVKAASVAEKEQGSYDVTITHSARDKGFSEQVFQALTGQGAKCFLDEAEKQSGPPLASGGTLVWVLSQHSVGSNYCCDRIALAYIANVLIIPVYLEKAEGLKEKLEFGTKLVLQSVKWYDCTEEDHHAERIASIADQVAQKKAKAANPTENPEVNEQLKHVSNRHKPVFQVTLETDPNYDFWAIKLGDADSVPWFRFEKSILEEFDEELKGQFAEEQIAWLLKTLKKEIFYDSDQASKKDFLGFTGGNPGKDYLNKRILSLVTEKLAMIDVFSMKSTVRLQAIDNLTKFSTPAVMQSLAELLAEEDANVRTVACITLGKLGKAGVELAPGTMDSLMRILGDKDRLVREAACITLGRLKANQAVPTLVNIWRNDFIHTVRVAASNALKQMDSEQANEAVYLTEKLLSEVKALSEAN